MHNGDKLSQRAINAIELVVSGNPTASGDVLAPYRSGPKLIDFFADFGCNDVYGGGFPSRHVYAKDSLRALDKDTQWKAVEAAVDPAHFLEFDGGVEQAVEYINKYLAFDGLRLVSSRNRYRMARADDSLVEVEDITIAVDPLAQEFVEEQLYKCRVKIRDEDYDGAITNARSLLEAVLSEIQVRLIAEPQKADGDLGKLFKRVQKALNLEPSRPDVADSLRQVLAGLSSIVNGIAPIRNRMSDAHARSFKPTRHHAKLTVNASHTAVDFLVETYSYQVTKGAVHPLS
ncbi:abortive infection family protein [Allorhodopirellula solitaria]|uniref:Abortive infection protein-like C-terminal domain-containing protein n=1 Tax=Allorhodopirellula solitaria TaxID=2527987 RepID=A0A5C5XUS2_9BACT|nr:abortive infection family protein [Allorhodopirellula solitaria]TWT66654.1 hypothetical protein CA85_27510 [Allorhodopirellula solitaria]